MDWVKGSLMLFQWVSRRWHAATSISPTSKYGSVSAADDGNATGPSAPSGTSVFLAAEFYVYRCSFQPAGCTSQTPIQRRDWISSTTTATYPVNTVEHITDLSCFLL